MTRKDFKLIAESLFLSVCAEDDVQTVCRRMADALAITNPRFDRARFLQACGISQ